MKEKWIKYPGPGEFRGEGTWTNYQMVKDEYTKDDFDRNYEYCKTSGYLPVAFQEKAPTEDKKNYNTF